MRIDVPTPPRSSDAPLLDVVQHKAFAFFWNETHADTGLTKDRAHNLERVGPDTYTIASIASVGYALAALPVGAQRGWVGRKEAEARAQQTLRFVHDKLPQHRGFFFHFVDWRTGAREWKSELSSVDSGLLALGALAAGRYFGGQVARLADAVYARMDWRWMQAGDGKTPALKTLSHGWKPESGFLTNRWDRYNEASFLYLLAMGSPTLAVGPDAWDAWEVSQTTVEGFPVFGGPAPLFFAQMTPGYFDLRGLRDRQNRDWWTNFANAHRANHAYCARNAGKFKTYSNNLWGITACDQPPPVGYGAQANRDGANDGTLAPTAALAGILVTPDLSLAALRTLWERHRDRIWGRYGFSNAFNVDKNWFDKDVIGIDLGMMLLAIENHRSGLVWRLMRGHPAVQKGLAAAGMRTAKTGIDSRAQIA